VILAVLELWLLSPLHFVVNWPVFTINICCFISRFYFKGPSSHRLCLTLKLDICAILWVMCAILYFAVVVQNFTVKLCKLYHWNIFKYVFFATTINISTCRHAGFSIFINLKFLTLGRVKRVKVRHSAKFCDDQSNNCLDMAIFRLFKMAAATMLDF